MNTKENPNAVCTFKRTKEKTYTNRHTFGSIQLQLKMENKESDKPELQRISLSSKT